MKKGILLLGVLTAMIFTSCKEDATSKVKEENVEVAAARDAQATEYPVMTFDETEYDFGTIEKGNPVEHKFTFTNTGKATTYGMPSGHSQMATLTATFWVLYLYKKHGFTAYNIFSMGLVILICLGILYSRWHLKCHTIQQIIFGSISGILFGIAGFYVCKIYFDI